MKFILHLLGLRRSRNLIGHFRLHVDQRMDKTVNNLLAILISSLFDLL